MAKSGHTAAQKPQRAHLLSSLTRGGWIPRLLISSDSSRTSFGQNSMQKPQPLHRSFRMCTSPLGGLTLSASNGLRQVLTGIRTTFCHPFSVILFDFSISSGPTLSTMAFMSLILAANLSPSAALTQTSCKRFLSKPIFSIFFQRRSTRFCV